MSILGGVGRRNYQDLSGFKRDFHSFDLPGILKQEDIPTECCTNCGPFSMLTFSKLVISKNKMKYIMLFIS